MISAPSRADSPSPGACLDDLLVSRFLPKRWTARIWSVGELPGRLQPCARNLLPGLEWRAYGDEDQLFFAIARWHAAGMPDQSGTAIDAYFLDANAVVYAAGVWEHSRSHGWWLDDVLELSYDCDRGWWLDAVLAPQSAINPRCAEHPPGAAELRSLPPPDSRPAYTGPDRRAPRRRKPRA
jgi:hypothetical protein